MVERRKAPRRRSYLGGLIAYNRRSSTMSCIVRNISSNGARIAFPSSLLVPEAFDLTIEHTGLDARARLVWRSGREIGVALEGASAQSSEVIPIGVARRMRTLDRENAALKQRLHELTSE